MVNGDDLTLSLDALVRSVAVRGGKPIAVFLGAGASVSSGISSAQDCINEWKREIFLTNNPHLSDQFRELTVPSVLDRIQKWLDQQGGYPVQNDSSEYGFYIERCYPIARNRREFFQAKIDRAVPGAGYELLALLAGKRRVDSVWTTNFDNLTARAATAANVPVYEVGLDSIKRLTEAATRNGVLTVALHGDYRYDALRNTTEELRAADETMRAQLVRHVRDLPLLVVGYSGRDASVMESLRQAYETPGPGALYWCGYSDAPSRPVEALIRVARKSGRTAYYIPAQGFDDLFWRISVQTLPPDDQQRVRELSPASKSDAPRKAFAIPSWPQTGFIKSNAFPLQCPTELYEIELTAWPENHGAWKYLRELSEGKSIVMAPLKGKVLALGTVDGLKSAFGPRFKSIVRTPISQQELGYDDGVVVELLRRALLTSVAERAQLASDGRSMLWRKEPLDRQRIGGKFYTVHDAANFSLRKIDTGLYLVLMPTLRVLDEHGERAPRSVGQPLIAKKLGYQHNDKFNDAINEWRSTLFSLADPFEFPANAATPFRFTVRRAPVFAGIRTRGGRQVRTPPTLTSHVKHVGCELPEPALLYANTDGQTTAEESHPIRGITANCPFDYALTLQGFAPNVTLGIICPKPFQNSVRAFFEKLQHSQHVAAADSEYLVDFPSFHGVFRLPIVVPQPGDTSWTAVAEPQTRKGTLAEAHELLESVVRGIEQLQAGSPSVIIVFIPDQWAPWERVETDDTQFDLHDSVKAFCVQRGIATQFLRQDTLRDPQVNRVMWWLSLALYAKSKRTPWVLKGLSDGTAYVGFGYSVDRKANRGSQIILGCSHMYNARGEGMEYRLSKVENPIWRKKNPFMSRDDAARVGRTIQELFFKARGELPRRVVIHKRSPFIEEERFGLREGLRGVDAIDLLEITSTPLRYVASKVDYRGAIGEDRWPVKRGTIVALDPFSALLWLHGAAPAINPARNYYQGKRRIPGPLLIRRHAGEADLILVAEEILALSKMDWNSFDMYQQLPATVQSSREIARIGALLQRFGNLSYDYRLFI